MASYNPGTGAWSYPANANNISSIIAPRIIRFGVRMTDIGAPGERVKDI